MYPRQGFKSRFANGDAFSAAARVDALAIDREVAYRSYADRALLATPPRHASALGAYSSAARHDVSPLKRGNHHEYEVTTIEHEPVTRIETVPVTK